MQLGMIGLGRMGANIVRRLMDGGHECVVYGRRPDSRQALEQAGAIGAASLDEFVAKLSKPRVAWVMVPAAATGEVVNDLASRMEPGDIIIDGGNSYYRDDIDRAEELKAKRHPLRRRRDERRRLRARARLLPDDRGRARTGRASRSAVQDHRPGHRGRDAGRPAAAEGRLRPSTAISTAGPSAPATS